MKKLFMLMFAVLTTAGLALPVWAAPNFIAGEEGRSLTIDSPLGDDTYIGGNTAVVNADIDGDLIVGANTAQINGQIAGDLWAGANTIVINDRVAGDVRIGAGEVVINGVVDDDVIVGSGKLTISEKAIIKGDLIAGSGDVAVYGKIYGNVRVAGGRLTLKAVINGDVTLKTDSQIQILPGTKIGGTLAYWSAKERPEFSKYARTVEFHRHSPRSTVPMVGAFMVLLPTVTIGLLLWKFFCLFLLGAVIIWLMPKLLPRVVTIVRKDYWRAFWQGLVLAVLAPIALMVLAMTLIGLPISIFAGLAYALMLCFAYMAAATLIGSWLVKRPEKTLGRQLGALAGGLVVLGVLLMIPLIGWLLHCVIVLMALGGFWQDRYLMFKAGKY